MTNPLTLGRMLALLVLLLLSGCNQRVSPDSYLADVRTSCRAVCEQQRACLPNPESVGAEEFESCIDSCAALEAFADHDQCASRMVLHNECKAAADTCEEFYSAWHYEPPCGPEATPSVAECSNDEPYDLEETP